MTFDQEKAAAIATFLVHGTVQPFVWGTMDCAMWACAWVLDQRGVDPLAEFRGTYDDAEGARSIMAPHNGLGGLMIKACALVGLERTAEPRMGDIAIVATLLGSAAMIATDVDRWAGKSPRGVWFLRATPKLVWRV